MPDDSRRQYGLPPNLDKLETAVIDWYTATDEECLLEAKDAELWDAVREYLGECLRPEPELRKDDREDNNA